MILVTGFEPFDGRHSNGSATCARYLDGFRIGGVTVHSEVLPVVWSSVREFCESVIATSEAVIIIGLGEADCVRPRFERQAHFRASGIDNVGAEPPPLPASESAGGNTLNQVLPCDLLKCEATWFAHLAEPMDVSKDAGSYLCNWYLLHALQHASVPAGFVHLPLQRDMTDSDYLNQHTPMLERFIEMNLENASVASSGN